MQHNRKKKLKKNRQKGVLQRHTVAFASWQDIIILSRSQAKEALEVRSAEKKQSEASSSTMPTVIGGKLKLKGASDKKKKRKKRQREEEEELGNKSDGTKETLSSYKDNNTDEDEQNDSDSFLTESQRKFEQKRRKAELANAKKIVKKSYRDRVEEFNHSLSVMSEHNDIPRVSAAGNG